jgi:hypothetical protein
MGDQMNDLNSLHDLLDRALDDVQFPAGDAAASIRARVEVGRRRRRARRVVGAAVGAAVLFGTLGSLRSAQFGEHAGPATGPGIASASGSATASASGKATPSANGKATASAVASTPKNGTGKKGPDLLAALLPTDVTGLTPTPRRGPFMIGATMLFPASQLPVNSAGYRFQRAGKPVTFGVVTVDPGVAEQREVATAAMMNCGSDGPDNCQVTPRPDGSTLVVDVTDGVGFSDDTSENGVLIAVTIRYPDGRLVALTAQGTMAAGYGMPMGPPPFTEAELITMAESQDWFVAGAVGR